MGGTSTYKYERGMWVQLIRSVGFGVWVEVTFGVWVEVTSVVSVKMMQVWGGCMGV